MPKRSRLGATVIIPTYNRATQLEMTLHTLTQQDTGCTYEVIVADDGSADSTFEVFRRFEQRLNVKYVYQPDRGYRLSRARNLGLDLAEGRVSIFLDCGNLVSKGFVSAHCNAHNNVAPTAVIGYIFGFHQTDVYSDVILNSLDVKNIERSIQRLALDERLLDCRERAYRACGDDINRLGMAWALFWGGNISLPTDSARELGGFDEAYASWGNEDIDFGLTAKLAGMPFLLQRSAAAVQYPHPKDPVSRAASWHSNMLYLHAKFKTVETHDLLNSANFGETVIQSMR